MVKKFLAHLESATDGFTAQKYALVWVPVATALTLILVTWICAHLQFKDNLYGQFMPSEAFGQPSAIKEKASLWFQKDKVGWDGQFYFHMANDPFILKDTIQHIDDPAYRYRRIGLALWAYGFSLLTFQDWVSPELYLLSHLLFLLLGIGIIAFFLIQKNRSPWWTFCWVLSVGTLSSFIHGLPDPMGDVGMVAGFVSFLSGYGFLTAFFFLFSGLARENTILIPLALLGLEVWRIRREILLTQGKALFRQFPRIWPLAISILFVALWHFYVWSRLGPVSPWIISLVLDWPFKQFFLKFVQKNDQWGLTVFLFSIVPILWFLGKSKDKRFLVFWSVIILSFSTGSIVWGFYRDLLKNFNYLLLLAPILSVGFEGKDLKRFKIVLFLSLALHFSTFLKLKQHEYVWLPRFCEACVH